MIAYPNLINRIKAITNRWSASETSHDRSRYVPNRPVGVKTDNTAFARATIIARARDREQNSPITQAILHALRSYGTHTGINPVPSTSSERFNERVLETWNQWCQVCDVSSRQHFYQLEAVIDTRAFVDGDIFTLLTYNDSGLPRIQLIEAHRCSSEFERNEKAYGPKEFDGVILNAQGRPVQYRFWEDDNTGLLKTTGSVVKNAEDVVHHFNPFRAGQVRGMSGLASVLDTIRDIDEIEKAEMRAVKDHSEISKVIYNESGEVEGDEIKNHFLTETRDQADQFGETSEVSDWYEDKIKGETVVMRRNKDRLELLTSNRPSPAWQGYIDHEMRKAFVGSGLSFEICWNPSEQGGATMRFIVEKDDRYLGMRQFSRIQEYQRIYSYVIGRHIDLGLLGNAPRDWYKANWKTPRKASVDIGRDNKATVESFKIAGTTLEDIHGDAGEDWKKKVHQKAREIGEAALAAKKVNEELGVEIKREEVLQLDSNIISAMANTENAKDEDSSAEKPDTKKNEKDDE